MRTKILLGERLNEHFINVYAEEKGVSIEVAREKATGIWILDCWPVNLSRAFRDAMKKNCPGITIRYIPAGWTGKIQIGDTHLHKPGKDFMRNDFFSWYRPKVVAALKKMDDAKKAAARARDEALAALKAAHGLPL